ncbi:MAG: HPr family phosphocarrier protein [Pseudomonadota bacterium]|jgi:phosphocarrier protein|nr:HPr family phosphocarrier protein [Syntrophaceae bacterium]MBP7033997.1 HPr family phosphocarrier protein [Syntrophobacterales bacterium]MDI9554296.1 HPr family phosphocarrier protein [Pseudomonadota bacterium]NLX30252.1 HPr family phosphocarrier protein [Deltaproteobacteria bacterium]HNU84674.1 HPr family phosphocarrier protein [Syntrophales bacterium]
MIVRKTLTIKNELGLHARSAAMIVRAVEGSRSEVFLERDGVRVDARSLLDILTLACPKDSRIVVRADGEDAREVVESIERLVESGFGEAA